MISRTVMIVDDNAAMCDNLEDILRDSGFDPCSAHSCSDGLKLAGQRKPVVALLDLKLPDGLGTELLTRLKKIDPEMVCIIITAFADIESALSALEQGAFHYLHKPVRPMELLQLLQRAFEMLRLQEEKFAAAEALRQSEEKYRSLVDNLNIGICRISGKPLGAFLQANPALAKMLGHGSTEELMQRSIMEIYQNEQERRAFLEELTRNGSVKDRELLCAKADGEPIWVSCSATAQFEPGGRIDWIDGVVEDVTDRKKLEEALRQSQKMEALGTLAGGVAHDFNNMLTAIMGFASLLQTRIGPDDPTRRYCDGIIASSQSAAKLTRDLLTFSRRQYFDLKPIKVNGTVQHCEGLLRQLLDDGIELKVLLCPEEPRIMADGVQVEQVLMNMIINARGAMPGGGLLTIETGAVQLDDRMITSLGHGEPGRYATISVSDTGCGMDEQTMKRIFEPFYSTKEVGRGTGLGLSIAYGVIKNHNGIITVSSELGKGTKFTMFFPATEKAVEEVQPVNDGEFRGGDETILLAEDNDEVRALVKHLLEVYGYAVIEAVDGEDAVTKFHEHEEAVQFLLFDVMMPRKNGKEAYEEIVEMNPEIKVLFMSGYTADILSSKGMKKEGVSYCSKPIAPKDLLHKVRVILDQ